MEKEKRRRQVEDNGNTRKEEGQRRCTPKRMTVSHFSPLAVDILFKAIKILIANWKEHVSRQRAAVLMLIFLLIWSLYGSSSYVH